MDQPQPITNNMSPQAEPEFHRFLDLPPELRNRIYSNLLEVPGELFLFQKDHEKFHARYRYSADTTEFGEPILTPGLLRSCKQIHQEATPILYGNNKLGASHSSAIDLLCQIGPSIQHIRSFFLGFWTRMEFSQVCDLLKGATSLRNFATRMRVGEEEDFAKDAWKFVERLWEVQKGETGKKERNVLDVIQVDLGLLDSGNEAHRPLIALAKQSREGVREKLEKMILAKVEGEMKVAKEKKATEEKDGNKATEEKDEEEKGPGKAKLV